MVYAIDILTKIMSDFGAQPQAMFQRDGHVQIVGKNVVGQHQLYLSITPENIPQWSDKKQEPEIMESDIAINDKGTIVKYKKYFKTMMFGTDTRQYTLDDAVECAKTIEGLDDDG